MSGFRDAHASDGLQQLLFRGDTLIIERCAQFLSVDCSERFSHSYTSQIEMLNVFAGFEQSK